MMVISPDEGGMGRAIYMANVLGTDMGMFYKRRDYATIINGTNPIVAHEFLGSDVKGKDMIVIDDMISSGGQCSGSCCRTEKTQSKPCIYLLYVWSVHQRHWRNLTRLMKPACLTSF